MMYDVTSIPILDCINDVVPCPNGTIILEQFSINPVSEPGIVVFSGASEVSEVRTVKLESGCKLVVE